MNNKYLLWLLCCSLILSCSKMDSSYEPYLKDGEKYYPGKPTNVEIHTGRNRAEVQFDRSADPSIVKYIAYWNNRLASKEFTANSSTGIEKIMIPDLSEGYYSFEIIAVDNAGNKSLAADANGNVYGSIYESNIYPRVATITNSQAGLIVNYVSVDTTVISTSLTYTTVSDVKATRIVSNGANVIDTLSDASTTVDSVQLMTAYLLPKAIDTFYAVRTVKINLAAGTYTETGTLERPGPTTTTLSSTVALTQVDNKTVWAQAAKSVFNNPAIKYRITLNDDNTVAISSDPTSSVVIYQIDPAPTYDPVEKKFTLNYEYLSSGNYRRFHTTLVLK